MNVYGLLHIRLIFIYIYISNNLSPLLKECKRFNALLSTNKVSFLHYSTYKNKKLNSLHKITWFFIKLEKIYVYSNEKIYITK